MKKDLLVEIPEYPTLDRISQLPPLRDISSVLLYREAFNKFEQAVLINNSSSDLGKERLPLHWLVEDHPDEHSAEYICSVFREKLPKYSDLSKLDVRGTSLTVVGGGSCLRGSKYATYIDSGKVVCRMNHPYIPECSEDVGNKTTIHFVNERRLYDYTRGVSRDDFSLLGVLNITIGTTSATAAYLEYARYLDSGGDPLHILTLKPSFRMGVGALHSTRQPSLGFLVAAFGIRTFGSVTLYGFDLGASRDHYHMREKLPLAHDPEFEAAEFINCSDSLYNFKIMS